MISDLPFIKFENELIIQGKLDLVTDKSITNLQDDDDKFPDVETDFSVKILTEIKDFASRERMAKYSSRDFWLYFDIIIENIDHNRK